jgi:hypothetical protein
MGARTPAAAITPIRPSNTRRNRPTSTATGWPAAGIRPVQSFGGVQQEKRLLSVFEGKPLFKFDALPIQSNIDDVCRIPFVWLARAIRVNRIFSFTF